LHRIVEGNHNIVVRNSRLDRGICIGRPGDCARNQDVGTALHRGSIGAVADNPVAATRVPGEIDRMLHGRRGDGHGNQYGDRRTLSPTLSDRNVTPRNLRDQASDRWHELQCARRGPVGRRDREPRDIRRGAIGESAPTGIRNRQAAKRWIAAALLCREAEVVGLTNKTGKADAGQEVSFSRMALFRFRNRTDRRNVGRLDERTVTPGVVRNEPTTASVHFGRRAGYVAPPQYPPPPHDSFPL